MKNPLFLFIIPVLFATGCCCQNGESDWDYSHETGDVEGGDSGGGTEGYPEDGVGGSPVATIDDAVVLFKDALVAGEPDFIIALTADEIMIGEPFSEGARIPRSEFAKMLKDPESPFTQALFSKERVSSFVNEYQNGTLDFEDTESNTPNPQPDGGKSVSTEAYDWYLEFKPTGKDYDNQWEMTICSVRFLDY